MLEDTCPSREVWGERREVVSGWKDVEGLVLSLKVIISKLRSEFNGKRGGYLFHLTKWSSDGEVKETGVTYSAKEVR